MKVDLVEILLIEDNPGDVLLTRKAFESIGIVNRLNVVPDGDAAVSYLRREGEYAEAIRPDLILLDINLPTISGHDVLEEIKQDPNLRRIPTIMLTSSERDRDVRASYDRHANSYITKPPKLSELIEVVKGLEHYWFALVRRDEVAE